MKPRFFAALLYRPLRYGFVDLLHQANRFLEGDDDALVVGDVVGAERAALAILQPLVAHLIAADFEVSHVIWHAAEVLLVVDPDRPHPSPPPMLRGGSVAHLFNGAASADGKRSDEAVQRRRLPLTYRRNSR